MEEQIEKINEEIGHRLVKLGEACIINDRNLSAMEQMKRDLNDLFNQREALSTQQKPEIIISEK